LFCGVLGDEALPHPGKSMLVTIMVDSMSAEIFFMVKFPPLFHFVLGSFDFSLMISL
jgi:hypothetical protein